MESLLELLKRDLQLGESQTIELNEQIPDQKRDLGKIVASFGTSNAGTIYIGIDDHGNVKGLPGIHGFNDIAGKDEFQRRIRGITNNVEPPLQPRIDFIDVEGKIVARVAVPKGARPVYYYEDKPYVRYVDESRPAKVAEVEDLYQKYFEGLGRAGRGPRLPSEEEQFVSQLFFQLSDVRLIGRDYRDHLINPDLDQMLYDLGATGRILIESNTNEIAKDIGMSRELKQLGEKLEDLESHQFYIGSESVDEFGTKLSESVQLAERLYQRLRKRSSPRTVPDFAERVRSNLRTLANEWDRRKSYLEKGELERLRETFRRLGYTFYRLSVLPETEQYPFLSTKLTELGELLRNLSSVDKYFLRVGETPLDKIEPVAQKFERLGHEISESLAGRET